MRVLLSGGGTGGHLVPGLNLARLLLARGHGVHLVRSGRAVEEHFLHGLDGLQVHALPVAGRGLALPFAISRGVGTARRLLDRHRIDVVVGLGGRSSLPCVFAAMTLRRPFVLLEQNLQPGRANRFVSRFARRVYTAFPDTVELLPGRVAVATGMPLREGLGATLDGALLRRFGVAERSPILLVLGGSQGAQAINIALPAVLAGLSEDLRARMAVIHVAGPGKEAATAQAYRGTGLAVHILGFYRDMPSLYAAADLVLCRGGGTSLLEIAAAGRPAIVVPFPWHRDHHQAMNAAWFDAIGAFRVLPQEDIEAGGGGELIQDLLADPERRQAMGARARAAVRTDAGARIADDIATLVPAEVVCEEAG